MSDDGERTCPLCAEEMDLTDQQLKPCKCGYENLVLDCDELVIRLRYITYAKDEEAVRCIQAVHNFVLEGKSLSNPDCLYLHDIGSQEDSFTKDEIISLIQGHCSVPCLSCGAVDGDLQVCSSWRAVSRSELLWQDLCRRVWSRRRSLLPSWRDEFVRLHRTAANFRFRRCAYSQLLPASDDALSCPRVASRTKLSYKLIIV
ncbi:RNA recognition, partial [Musa troglodytarum]